MRTAGRQIKEIISLCEFPYADTDTILPRRHLSASACGSGRRIYVFLYVSVSASKGRDKSVFSREAANERKYERIETFFG